MEKSSGDNFVRKIWQRFSSASQSRTFSLLILLLIIASVPLTVFVAGQIQELRQRATGLTCGDHSLDVALSVLPNQTKIECKPNEITNCKATINYSIRENVPPANITHLGDEVNPTEGVSCAPTDAKNGSCTAGVGQYQWKHKWKFCNSATECTPECTTIENVTINGFEIHGTVFEDTNANGSFDQTGTTPERWKGGVPITISGPVTKTITTAAESGQYYFTDLPAGTYKVGIDLSSQDLRSYEITTRNGSSQIVNLTQGFTDVSWGIKQTAQQTLTISGTVWVDELENGKKDPIEGGKENISITLSGNNISRTRITNTAGHYFFRDLTPGTYTATIAVPQGFRITTNDPESRAITLTGELAETDVSWGIKSIATSPKFNISGVVFIDINSDGNKGANEAALTDEVVGAKVKISGTLLPSNYEKEKTVVSGGQYSFEDLVDGSYTLEIINLPPTGNFIATSGINGKVTIRRLTLNSTVNLGIIQTVSQNREPVGFLDRALCTVPPGIGTIYGWTCDPDNFNTALNVNFYEGTNKIGSALANKQREQGVGLQCGGNVFHGFEFPMPASLKTGEHKIYAKAINTPPGTNPILRSGLEDNTLEINCSATTAAPDPTKRYSASINVYIDTDGDGFKDGNERGYPNAILKGEGTAFGRIIESKTLVADSNGHVTVTNLQSGDYWLELIVPSGYQITTGSNPIRGFLGDDNAPPPSRNVTINFGITLVNPPVPTYSINGSVFTDNDGNGRQDNDPADGNVDRGYGAIVVKLCRKDPPTAQGRGCAYFPSFYDEMRATNGEGWYSFDNLDTGTYKLTIGPQYQVTTGNNPTGDLTLPPDRTVNFGIKAPPVGGIITTINPPPPTKTIVPSKSPTPIASKTPTKSPTPKKSPTPPVSSTPTGSVIPTPTDDGTAKHTRFEIITVLQAIGPLVKGNTDPKHKERQLKIEVFDKDSDKPVLTKVGTINYEDSTGFFKALVDMGATLRTGDYAVKLKVIGPIGYLRKLVPPGIVRIRAGETNRIPRVVPSVTLVVGDINNDNTLDIKDYNEYLSCFGKKADDPKLCKDKVAVDLNDDGITDVSGKKLTDYSWLFNSFQNQYGD